MDTLSTQVIIKALDGLSARAEVTAHNIANGNTPGYRPLRVRFEDALVEAAATGAEAVRAVRPEVTAETGASGRVDMRLDLELATASSTALRYAALVDLLNRQMQVHALALSGGK